MWTKKKKIYSYNNIPTYIMTKSFLPSNWFKERLNFQKVSSEQKEFFLNQWKIKV